MHSPGATVPHHAYLPDVYTCSSLTAKHRTAHTVTQVKHLCNHIDLGDIKGVGYDAKGRYEVASLTAIIVSNHAGEYVLWDPHEAASSKRAPPRAYLIPR